jgi:hypothetical protein
MTIIEPCINGCGRTGEVVRRHPAHEGYLCPECRDADTRRQYLASATEKQLMQTIINAARATGWMAYHTFDSRKSAAGFPDLVLLRHGQIVVFECKAQRGRVSPQQEVWLNAWAMCGAFAVVVRPIPKGQGEISYSDAISLLGDNT